MLRVYGKPFVDALEIMGQLNALSQILPKDSNIDEVPHYASADLVGIIDKLIEQLKLLELNMTIISANRFRNCVMSCRTISNCAGELTELYGRLNDEIESVHLLFLSPNESELFESKAPRFGDVVSNAFPSVKYEIDEAAKCLALERSTACVFHSIRCLEAVIRAISRCVRLPDPTKGSQRSWFKMLDAFKTEMDKRWPISGRLTGDGKIFEEIYAALAAMQNPYRNDTMHLDKIYTLEDARDIFGMVGGLMRKAAARLDENGQPLA
jgi:hypothetical protein